MKTDRDIQANVKAELDYEPAVDATEIDIDVASGVVTLIGRVPSCADSREAERAAGRVAGVLTVKNELVVEPPEGIEPTDSDLAATCMSILSAIHAILRGAIRATVEGGFVRLSGEVDWAYQRQAAEEVVRGISGIRGVTNGLTVRPRVSSGNVRRMIADALTRVTAAEANRLDVQVDGQTVTLRGNVSSWHERQDAARAAFAAPGISHVENLITVVQ